MRRFGIGAVVVLLVLGGCTPDSTPPPRAPVVTVESVESSPPVFSDPSDYIRATDTVNEFFGVWTRISRELDTADREEIRQVADEIVVGGVFVIWDEWSSEGLHLVGSPGLRMFTSGNIWLDVEQTWYILEGCFMAEDSYLADSLDSLVRDFGGRRIQMKFLVNHRLDDDSFTVMHVTPEEGTC